MAIDITSFSTIEQQALGLDASHLQALACGNHLHPEAAKAFLQLQRDAQKAGFNMQIVSSYRNFERQLTIFNAKAEGKRPLLDDNGQPLNFDSLSREQRLWAILRWSAIAGGSRHHFGSDIDIYDANTIKKADVQLVPEEVEGQGPMAAMHNWLDEKIAANKSYGFFRPYQMDVGAIAPERWHISFAPVAQKLEAQINTPLLQKLYQQVQSPLKPELLQHLDEIVARFIAVSPKNKPNWLL